jgi:hypothetical protein
VTIRKLLTRCGTSLPLIRAIDAARLDCAAGQAAINNMLGDMPVGEPFG